MALAGGVLFWRRPKGDFLTDGADEWRKWRNLSLGDSTRSCSEPAQTAIPSNRAL